MRPLVRLCAAAALAAIVSACARHAPAPPPRPAVVPEANSSTAATRVPAPHAPLATPVRADTRINPPPAPTPPTPDVAAPSEPAIELTETTARDITIVRAAIPWLRRDPARANRELARSNAALAHTWRAYLDWVAGRRHSAQRRLEALHSDFDEVGEPVHGLTDVRPILSELLRLASDAYEDQLIDREHVREILPCELFAWHPREATAAFAPQWGSGRDAPFSAWRDACLESALRAALPEPRARAVRAAFGELVDGATAVRPYTGGGSIIWGFSISTTNVLGDVLLAPEAATIAQPPDDALRDEIAYSARQGFRVDARAARYRALVARLSPQIAEGICAIAQSRGVPMTPARCADIANAAAIRMLVTWLHDTIGHE